ncbi:MAG TPA: histidine phosphotransferase family protein [Rhizomicrobium sp.]|jgi:histidine phosphotransferase ChpT|nr:histidine phosphotransferase family protein [Rhizomicrobium sp.]HEX4535287.1 histidine phosphotransferase family protein [Rhizomicrobium sp.]
MTEMEFAALLVSRVCHDLVSPVGAVVNGLEVLEDETDAAMRADALKLVASSAEQAAARLQFARVAFGAAGSAGAELDLNEVGRVVKGFMQGGKTELTWNAAPANWPKDWAKLLMNATLLGAESLPRGGQLVVETSADASSPSFQIRATGQNARVLDEVEKAMRGEPVAPLDGRSIQAYLTYRLARSLNAGLTLTAGEGSVKFAAG